MSGEFLLKLAAETFAERKAAYGNASDLFDGIAKRWSMTLGTQVTADQVAMCMIDLKMARLAHDPRHADSILDVAGYAACLHEVTSKGGQT
ncbi:DUF6378 domain-containing protein [Pseudemcibacter aquimaris]|uniref:DUF6378 domain-containing protein n=1 Tax=Pseudemcibacter aquimaris TaxID=2857064 RepID=UPI002010F175|nr:DUF6378 domain-containing protein [Pseudemcibacter aquimaris]MCC3862638.1 DUF6378 domain-containing protein [Pseudemcibacter aquimaris]WDU57878.1 hypothetical protein KW060_11785 [Pseudemcibacter aquimaris]